MKYWLIDYFDEDNPFIILDEITHKPLIFSGSLGELKEIQKTYAQNGILVPICKDLIDVLYDSFDFIFEMKNLLGEDIDIGESGIENREDCLERRIGKFTCYEE